MSHSKSKSKSNWEYVARYENWCSQAVSLTTVHDSSEVCWAFTLSPRVGKGIGREDGDPNESRSWQKSTLSELELFCKEESTNISVSICAKLIETQNMCMCGCNCWKRWSYKIFTWGGGRWIPMHLKDNCFVVLIIFCVTMKYPMHFSEYCAFLLMRWWKIPLKSICLTLSKS